MARPFFEKKRVILCRSGIYQYTKDEVANWRVTPVKDKDVYDVYRPASVLLIAADKMRNLPITKEHPPEFINGTNWNRYAQGYTGSEIQIVGLGDGEVGIESTIFFSTAEIYEYFLEGNGEVSLGYLGKYSVVDDPDEVGYDLLLEEIVEVNHLAVTRAGRGGPKVAIKDSLLGGILSMKTGILAFLRRFGKTVDAKQSFIQQFFDALEKASKGKPVDVDVLVDSVQYFKDSEEKTLLLDMIVDCFSAPKVAYENKDTLMKVIQDAYEKAEKTSVEAFTDEDGKGTNTNNISDAEEVKEDEKKEEVSKENVVNSDDEKEDTETEKEDDAEDSKLKTKDSIVQVVDDRMKKYIDDLKQELAALVQKEVKQALGLTTDGKIMGSPDTNQIPATFDIRDFLN